MSDYYKHPGISQSGLTNFSLGPQYYKSKEVLTNLEESDALIIGSVVDLLLSNPNDFNSEITVLTLDKPTGQLGDFCDAVIYATKSEIENVFEYSYNKVGFKRDTIEKVLERYYDQGQAYVNQRLSGNSKLLITPSQYTVALNVYNSLLSSKYTTPHILLDNPNIESIKQLEIYWEYTLQSGKKVQCKSKLDDLWINHESKTLHLKDFKTTGFHVAQFPKSFIRFRYDLQASFYWDAVEYYKTYIDTRLKDYEIKDFVFIVESTKYVGTPVIYVCSSKDIDAGANGGTTIDGKVLKGYKQLIEDLQWHIENDEWEYPRTIIEANGLVTIDAFIK